MLHNIEFYQRNILKLVTKGGELKPFNPNSYQLELNKISVSKEMQRILVLKCRQIGISTWGASNIYHKTATQFNKNALIIADDDENSGGLFRMTKLFYENSEPLVRPMQRYSNEKALEFNHPDKSNNSGLNSKISVTTAGKLSAGRSKTIQYLHCSEFAYWPNAAAVSTGLFQSVPLMDNTSILIESTANGVGGKGAQFYEMCMRSIDGDSAYKFFFFDWKENPDYEMNAGDDFKLTDEEKDLAEKHPNLTKRKLAFRRYKIQNEMGSTILDPRDQFKQEYPNCLTGEVRVSTEMGILPIKDSLLAKKTESGAVLASGPQPESQIYKLTTKMGRTIRGTGDHPVHTPSGKFVYIKDLKEGEDVTLRPPMFAEKIFKLSYGKYPAYKTEVLINRTWARFLGYYMGDGSWYKGTVSIMCDAKDQDVIQDVSCLFRELFKEPSIKIHQRVKGRKGAEEVRVCIVPAMETFYKLDIIHNRNGTAPKRNVCIPECIWRSPRHIVKEFLSCLFEADGSASNGVVRWASCKEDFAKDVQLLLLGFGINAPMSLNLKKSGNGNPYKSYVLSLGAINSRKFHDEIGFRGERKKALRKTAPPRSNGGRLPKDYGMIDYVEKVELDGTEATYDFTIEGDHVFMANGILTHNTAVEAFISSGRPCFNTEQIHKDISMASEGERYTYRAGGLVPDSRGEFYVFKTPENRAFSLGADIAEGLESGDFSTACVINKDLEVCCTYSGHIDPDQFGEILVKLAKWYNGAIITHETNNHGHSVSNTLKRLGYNKLWKREVHDELGKEIQDKIGWNTNVKTKMLMLDELVAPYRDGLLKVNCKQTLREMLTIMIEDGGGVVLNGKDRTVALGLSIQGLKQASVENSLKAFVPGKGAQRDVTKMTIEEKMAYYKRGGK